MGKKKAREERVSTEMKAIEEWTCRGDTWECISRRDLKGYVEWWAYAAVD